MSRLVVLGSCGGWPEAGRACSGYLLEHGGARVVLDLGYGTLPRLLALLGSTAGDGVNAVVVTHAHPDHLVDLHGLFRARRYVRRGAPAIPLYAAPGVLAMLAGLEAGDTAAIAAVFDAHPLPAGPYQVGPFQLESWGLPHYVPNAGVRLSAPGLTVAYTGDTASDPALVEVGRDADLYVMAATDWPQQPARTGPWRRGTATSPPTRQARPPRPPAPDGSCSPTSGPATTGRPPTPRPPSTSPGSSSWPTKAWRSTCPDRQRCPDRPGPHGAIDGA